MDGILIGEKPPPFDQVFLLFMNWKRESTRSTRETAMVEANKNTMKAAQQTKQISHTLDECRIAGVVSLNTRPYHTRISLAQLQRLLSDMASDVI